MSKFEFDLKGLSLLYVVKAYPERVVAFIEQHNKRENVEFLSAMITMVGEYQNSLESSSSQRLPMLELINWLGTKLAEAERLLVTPANVTEDTSNYDVVKNRVSKTLPKYYLGQEVYAAIEGVIEKGIIVKLEMPFNGLYISPEKSDCQVWFSTDSTNGWVVHTFKLSDITPVVQSQGGKEKRVAYIESTGCFECLFYSSRDPCTLPGGPQWKDVYAAWREGGFALGCPLTKEKAE